MRELKTEPTAAARAPALPDHVRPCVRVIDATATPSKLLLTRPISLGSSADSDMVIRDATVSRHHAEITVVPEGIRVRDLDSLNGTFYLGQRIKELILQPGARVQVGAVTVSLDVDEGALIGDLHYDGASYGEMIGESAAMHRLFALLGRLRKTTLPVLILGESGVGKEQIARTLHVESQVAAGPLVVLNCGAFPRELVASELFGHRRGAFTGATEARKGAFEQADGGTLFLDELGELPLEVQPLLLRALELGEVRRVGDDEPRFVKVRLVAATHRDLELAVKAKQFREDLYYRIAVVRLTVPPLRERIGDIPALAARFAADAGLVGELPAPVVEHLKSRAWPGNVRELRNVVASFVALGMLASTASGAGSLEGAMQAAIDLDRPYAEQKAQIVDAFTAAYLPRLLSEAGGNLTVAAKRAGLDRNYLRDLLAKHGITPRGRS